jgi:hypothetical protein
MKEYQSLLDKFCLEGYSMYSDLIPECTWNNRSAAEIYLEKYWLPSSAYEAKWKAIQDRIFVKQVVGLPELVFTDEYEMITLRGGCLFTKDDFRKLQECMLAIGDQRFVVVENTYGQKVPEPGFRMQFPVGITWEEITSGDCISGILLAYPHNDYYVYGDSEVWGKYAANDYTNPLDIIAFRETAASVFKEKFRLPDSESREMETWLPPSYKARIKVGILP